MHQVNTTSTPEHPADVRRRRDALATSIALWLGTMSLDELGRVDERVMEVLRDRDDEEWARHEGETCWHLIANDNPHSVCTCCSGRWSKTDTYDTDSRPPRAERCETCQRVYELRAQARAVERGLVELRDAEPVTAPRPRVGLQDDAGDVHELFDVGGEG